MNPMFAYLTVLSIVQPAGILEIKKAAKSIIPAEILADLPEDAMQQMHSVAKKQRLVLQIRRNIYVLTHQAWMAVRSQGLERELDNRRFFLIKAQRRRLKW